MLSEQNLRKTGTFLILLTGVCIFMDKVPVNLSTALLALTTLAWLIRFGTRRVLAENPYMALLLVPLALGFVLSFFSLAGVQGALGFLPRFRFFLLVIPFALFVRDRETLERLFLVMNAGAFLDIAYCMVSAGFTDMYQEFWGFHKFSRNAAILFSLCVFNLTYLLVGVKSGTWREKPLLFWVLLANTVLILVSVFLLGERGAWLGLYISVAVVLVLYEKRLIIALLVITALSPLFLPEDGVDRIKSIVDTGHFSNQIRLKLYRVGFDFLVEENCWFRGTGARNVKEPVQAFFDRKPESYRQTYYETYMTYFNSFHNSFLQMAVEGGLLFALSYLACHILLLLGMLKRLKTADPPGRVYLLAAIALTPGFFISQFFHEELFRYGGLVFALIFYSGCLAASGAGPDGRLKD
jgi:O-antigen ligase